MAIRRGASKLARKAFLKGKRIYKSARSGYKRAKSAPGQKALFETPTERKFQKFFSATSNRGSDALIALGGAGAGVFGTDYLTRRRARKTKRR